MKPEPGECLPEITTPTHGARQRQERIPAVKPATLVTILLRATAIIGLGLFLLLTNFHPKAFPMMTYWLVALVIPYLQLPGGDVCDPEVPAPVDARGRRGFCSG